MAKTHSSYLDDEALDDLSGITARYWSISKNASVDVLSGISGHFSNIVQFLKDSHPTAVYDRLCSLVSENALLLGKAFHDIKEYDLAHIFTNLYQELALTEAMSNRQLDAGLKQELAASGCQDSYAQIVEKVSNTFFDEIIQQHYDAVQNYMSNICIKRRNIEE